MAETLWVLVEQAAIRTRDDTPTLAAGSGEALEARLAHLLGQPAPRAQPWRSLLLSGALLGLLVGLDWIFVQAGMTNVLCVSGAHAPERLLDRPPWAASRSGWSGR